MSAGVGPLSGLRVVEIASAAPAPFACMMLADLGADVVRIDRPGGTGPHIIDPLTRARRIIEADLKDDTGRETVLRLADSADVLIEGFRPGVMERLGLGPDVLLKRAPRLIYGRMTGFGQTGPLAHLGGHDINYISIAGALDPIGTAGGPPVVPANFISDFGGGGMLLAVGVLAALHERSVSGIGQVIDASMVEGGALLTASMRGMMESGNWNGPRGTNLVDGGAPFYRVYETSDGRHMSVGPIEGKFYAELIDGLGLDTRDLPKRFDQSQWPQLHSLFEERFRTRSREEWITEFADRDACVTPVLTPSEAVDHPHMKERKAFGLVDGMWQPAPAPRFSRSETQLPSSPSSSVAALDDILRDWPVAAEVI